MQNQTMQRLCVKCRAALNTTATFCGNCGTPAKIISNALYQQMQPQQIRPATNYGVKEYRRTCHQCGKVWHSLVSREKQIQKTACSNSFDMCDSGCNKSIKLQASRNLDANRFELDRLRQCPNCRSSNYYEEVLNH